MNWETTIDEQELKHYGVKGQKWGVRKQSVSESKGRISKQHSSKKKSSTSGAKIKKGESFIKRLDRKKLQAIIATTATVASGALWVASAFLPGAGAVAANGAASIANMLAIGANH